MLVYQRVIPISLSTWFHQICWDSVVALVRQAFAWPMRPKGVVLTVRSVNRFLSHGGTPSYHPKCVINGYSWGNPCFWAILYVRKPLYNVNLRMWNLGFDVKELAISIKEIASLGTLPKSTRVYISVDIMPLVLQQDPQEMPQNVTHQDAITGFKPGPKLCQFK